MVKVHTAAKVGARFMGGGGTLNLYIIDVTVRDCQRHARGGVLGCGRQLGERGN